MKNLVYVEVVGDTASGRLMRLKNMEWGRGEKLRMQMLPARMGLDSIVQYVNVELKLNSKNEGHIKDRHGHGSHNRREDRSYREIQEAADQSAGSEDGKTSSGEEYTTQ